MRASLIALAIAAAKSTPALAAAAEAYSTDPIVVTGHHDADSIEQSPSTRASVTAEQIGQKVNAVSVRRAGTT